MPARCGEAASAFSLCSSPARHKELPAARRQLVSPGPSTLPSAEGGLGIWASRSSNLGFLLNQNGSQPSFPPPTQGCPTHTARPPAVGAHPHCTSLWSSGHHLWLSMLPLLTTSPIKNTHTPEVAERLQRLYQII